MGHIINPVSQRLGYSHFWSANWSLSSTSRNYSYAFLSIQATLLIRYLKRFFILSMKRLFGKGVVLLDFKVFKVNQQTTFILECRVKHATGLRRLLDSIFSNIVLLRRYHRKSSWLAISLNGRAATPFTKTRDASFSASKSNKAATIGALVARVNDTPAQYNVKPKFIRKTGKLTKYISTVMQPDLYAYPWASFLALFAIKKRCAPHGFASAISSLPQKALLQTSVSYLLTTHWIKNLHRVIAAAVKNLYYSAQPMKILLNILSGITLTANFIARYLATRLLQKFPLRRVLTTLIKQLQTSQHSGHIHGFKIMCNGRFERRGRATHVWKISGKVPSSDVNLHVDYAMMLPVLTNSICAIKVWLTRAVPSEKMLII